MPVTIAQVGRVLAALSVPIALQGVGAQTVSPIDHAVNTYATMRTSRMIFTQTITNPLTGVTSTSRGEMQQQVPGKIAVRFTEPPGDRIVSDGQYLWIYLPSSAPGQVIRSPAATNSAGVPDVTAQFLESPKKRYLITDRGPAEIRGRDTHAVELVPKDRSAPFVKATIWVDDEDGIVRQFEVTDGNGLVRQVTFLNVFLNVSVAPATFVFKAPSDAKIIEQ